MKTNSKNKNMKQFVAIIEVRCQYGQNYWLKSLKNETLEDFKQRVLSVYNDSHVEFYELGSMI